MDNAAIVSAARQYLGTPFHHQGRVRGAGIDCVGLVIGVAHDLGLSNFDTADYSRQPDPVRMGETLDAHLDRVKLSAIRPGDILWLRMPRDPMHLAIVSGFNPLRVIHAFSRPGLARCVEHSIDDAWRRRIVACFRFRESA